MVNKVAGKVSGLKTYEVPTVSVMQYSTDSDRPRLQVVKLLAGLQQAH